MREAVEIRIELQTLCPRDLSMLDQSSVPPSTDIASQPFSQEEELIQQQVVVVGAGITGLTLAYRLHQNGVQVLLVEASSRPGGSISTQTGQGYCWEEGPNSFTPTPALVNLIAEVGLADQLVWADGTLPRFIYWEGQLLPVPLDPVAALTTPLLSVGGKAKALLGLLGFVSPPPDQEETVEQFFTRQLGSEVAQRLISPFTSGVYAGDVQQLSAKAAFARIADLEANYGSLFAGIWQSPRSQPDPLSPEIHPQPKRGQLGNLREGLQRLPDALATQLGSRVQLGWDVKSIEAHQNRYRLHIHAPDGVKQVETRVAILTVSAYGAADILSSLQPQASPLLLQIPYPTVAVVALAYPETALPQPFSGFGHLIPRSQGLRTLGTIWSSCLFPDRAPQGHHLLLSFIGGATDPAYTRHRQVAAIRELTPAERADIVHQELSRVLLTQPVQPLILGEKLWARAIPQYTLGHRHRLHQIRNTLAPWPGIGLCANYLDGVSLGDCVKRANAQAERVVAFLQNPSISLMHD